MKHKSPFPLNYEQERENANNVIDAIKKYDLPLSMLTTKTASHGGAVRLMDTTVTKAWLEPALDYLQQFFFQNKRGDLGTLSVDVLAEGLSTRVSDSFDRLVKNKPCPISDELQAHLTNKDKPVGTTYTTEAEEADPAAGLRSPDLPAAFTFVGQFVDHDLTLNAMVLTMPQGGDIQDFASPRIDLDSVYGPREVLDHSPELIRDEKRFKFADHTPGIFDLPRVEMTLDGEKQNVAAIYDARNDENRMVLQVHMLLQRLHNSFIDADENLTFEEARKRTILNWQSVLLHDYLPRIIDEQVLAEIKELIGAGKFDDIKVVRTADGEPQDFRIPHEFSIGFRMGHSQLRSSYKINHGAPVTLFDNTLQAKPGEDPPVYNDLRGGQKMSSDYQIDWNFFLGDDGPRANAIDGKVTQAVFDLPPRAIPDTAKDFRNLAMRNLMRSRSLELCSGEELARFFKVTPLKPEAIEPDPAARDLFIHDGEFQTPLWYYLLKEAEIARPQVKHGPRNPLGPLGSRLIGEVICCAIKFNEINWWDEKQNVEWSVSGKAEVTLRDIVNHLGA